jgi:hypothetical protein
MIFVDEWEKDMGLIKGEVSIGRMLINGALFWYLDCREEKQ